MESKQNRYVLEGYQPIDDFFFFSCFNSALFPILEYLRSSYYPVIISNIPVYESGYNEGKTIRLHYIILADVLGMQKALGVETEMFMALESQKQIYCSLSAQIPMIVTVDCFYLTYRRDYYQKSFYRHAVPVIGYDKNCDQVLIVDKLSEEESVSKFIWLPTEELIKANHMYIKHMAEPAATVLAIKKSKAQPQSEIFQTEYLRELYLTNIKKLEKETRDGLEEIRDFGHCFQVNLSEAYLCEEYESLLIGMNDIIKTVKAQLHLYNKIFRVDAEEYQIKSKIYAIWQKIRIRLLKYEFTKIFQYDYLAEIYQFIEEISKLEGELFWHITGQSTDKKGIII